MEVQEDKIVLFCDDSTFRNVPREKDDVPMVGEYVSYRVKNKRFHFTKSNIVLPALSLTVLLIFLLGNFFLSQPSQQQAYVLAIDINPSIEISLDENFHVIDVRGLNEDARDIIEQLKIKENNIERVISNLIKILKKENYLSENESSIISSTLIEFNTSVGQSDTRIETVENVFQLSIAKEKIAAKLDLNKENKQFYEEATESQLSVNVYRIYQKISEKDKKVDMDEFKDKSIAEIRKMTKQNESSNKDSKDTNENPPPTQKIIDKSSEKESENPESGIEKNLENKSKNAPSNSQKQNKQITPKSGKNSTNRKPVDEKQENVPKNESAEDTSSKPESNRKQENEKPQSTKNINGKSDEKNRNKENESENGQKNNGKPKQEEPDKGKLEDKKQENQKNRSN